MSFMSLITASPRLSRTSFGVSDFRASDDRFLALLDRAMKAVEVVEDDDVVVVVAVLGCELEECPLYVVWPGVDRLSGVLGRRCAVPSAEYCWGSA